MKYNSLSFSAPDYPALLKSIFDPPSLLYVDGRMPDFDLYPPIAIVGSRKPTEYGKLQAERLAKELVAAGFCIVSGLAYGIDSVAHRATLAAQGKTVAVLGSGLDLITPSAHKGLAKEIVDSGGAILTEFKIGTPGLPYHFPLRNRIISGLSLGVIVIEAAIDSGSLITAESALEQNREVFAMPGPVGNINSAGTHRLIKEGAALVETAADVIEVLAEKLPQKWQEKNSLQNFGSSDKEHELLNLMGRKPVGLDYLIETSGLVAKEVIAMLGIMEMKNLVKSVAGNQYIKQKTND